MCCYETPVLVAVLGHQLHEKLIFLRWRRTKKKKKKKSVPDGEAQKRRTPKRSGSSRGNWCKVSVSDGSDVKRRAVKGEGVALPTDAERGGV